MLCVKDYKTNPRTFYDYGPLTTTHAVLDAGFYNGWIGGTYELTPFPFMGNWLTSRATADLYCQMFFGPTARIAEHHDGWYMPMMNSDPALTTG